MRRCCRSALLACLLLLCACGNKGDLVLPGPPPAEDGAAVEP
jgi:predicted small lipoprotein YifL